MITINRDMRKILFTVFLMIISVSSEGQIAKWLIPPMYDNIHMANGEKLIITDSLNKKIIWSQTGKRLSMTEDQIHSFEEGYGVTIKRGTGIITGFYDKNGKFTSLSGCNATFSMPYFSNQHLLVQEGYYYRFVNLDGEIGVVEYAKAYPFSNGYASCQAFTNLQKKKETYNLLLSKDNDPISFSFGGKQFDNDDIEFISSVNDESIGFVVAKRKLYYFNGKDRSLTPVFAKKDETNIKNQAKVEYDISSSLSYESDSVTILQAKAGKKDFVQIKFNQIWIPLSIKLTDGEYVYEKNIKTKTTYDSPLRLVKNYEKCGIVCDGKEILPPQLDDLITCFDDKAFVRLSGKCGMLQVLKDEDFKITINKGDKIDFKHQKKETTIRLDLPKIISAYNTRIEVDPKSGCEVDMTSGEKKDTEFGNYILYNCVLNFPQSLPDEMYGDERNDIIYPIQIVYDGLKSPIMPFKVKAWHHKYINVDVNDSEISMHQGTLSFTFNINPERDPGEAVYPMNIIVKTDSSQYVPEKISETRYRCKISELNEGINNVVIQIMEEGCPPTSSSFEVTYTKPSAKTASKSAVKEGVAIRKKTTKTPANPTPYLPT